MALRHLLRGGAQTWLTIAAVAAGVTVIVFISSLTFGLRNVSWIVPTSYALTSVSDWPGVTSSVTARTITGSFLSVDAV